jgi:hypothetical protein
VTDLAVFYSADHQLALAVVHSLNGDFSEAERLPVGPGRFRRCRLACRGCSSRSGGGKSVMKALARAGYLDIISTARPPNFSVIYS